MCGSRRVHCARALECKACPNPGSRPLLPPLLFPPAATLRLWPAQHPVGAAHCGRLQARQPRQVRAAPAAGPATVTAPSTHGASHLLIFGCVALPIGDATPLQWLQCANSSPRCRCCCLQARGGADDAHAAGHEHEQVCGGGRAALPGPAGRPVPGHQGGALALPQGGGGPGEGGGGAGPAEAPQLAAQGDGAVRNVPGALGTLWSEARTLRTLRSCLGSTPPAACSAHQYHPCACGMLLLACPVYRSHTSSSHIAPAPCRNLPLPSHTLPPPSSAPSTALPPHRRHHTCTHT
jgi:hypothetical protein